MRLIEMAGKKFGRLTVIRRADGVGNERAHWECECDCGNHKVVSGDHLRSGHTQSCGCLATDPEERFIDKIEVMPSGCIEWIAGNNGVGYGLFYFGRGVRGYAHRWAYEHYVGPIPDGLHLDHLCRNTKCVNPDHLEPVTCQVNLLRGEGPSAKHAKKTHCPQGHPYSGDNLYTHPTKGIRYCRACGRIRAAAARRRTREQKKEAA